MSDLISVIVPVYNAEEYLNRSVDSILAQTHPQIEPVLIDDGASDGSGQMLDEYAARNPEILVIHKKNAGVTKARLDGVKAAQGEEIGFVDDDDEIASDMYERLLGNMKEYGADISHCGYRMINADGSVRYFYNTGKLDVCGTTEGIRALLAGIFEPSLCNKLYRAEICQQIVESSCMDTDIRNNEDLLMNYYLFKQAGHLVFEDRCLYSYYKHTDSASGRILHNQRVRDPIRVKKEILTDCRGTNLEVDAGTALLETCIHTYHFLLRNTDAERKTELQLIRNEMEIGQRFLGNLSRKYRGISWMIKRMPGLYGMVYRAYVSVKYERHPVTHRNS